ncbi:MAG TPA: UvrD-helicase domain-containing protein [Gemmata sp.]|jgi:ATP-dependent helicase/nuclease subunit A|nr:UvrD-helicase domain-containing protein [Gemmata sp.]
MPSELTPQQRIAVETRGTSIVLASGAGCGKTHVLTARYLSHLTNDNAAVGQVVAITFTDRAAREMRERIRTAIEKLPHSVQHLRDLETAPIATFHAFCGNLLRQFAIPAGLDPAFEVLDDVLSTNLRTEAITTCLRALLSTEEPYSPITTALRELIVLFGYPIVVEAVDSLLLEVDRPAWQAWLERSPHEIAADWTNGMRAALLPEWVAYLCAASPKVARCLSLLQRVVSPNPEVMKKVGRLLTEVPRLHEADNIVAKIGELTELAKVGRSGKKDWPDEAVYESVKKAFEDFRADLPKRFDLFTADTTGTVDSARIGQLFLRIALTADDEYRRRKRRAGVLDFQDLLTLTRDLLRERVEVRESLRHRFRFLLLDELQDTDPVQMELVELLAGSGLENNKLFAVGDHKQSIYRFRGADVGLFRSLRAAVSPAGRLGLTQNFRSQPGILHFVNALFSKRIPDYDPLTPHKPSASAAANVELLWTVNSSENRADSGFASDLRASEAVALARRITELLADSTPRVFGKDGTPRRVERQDIVLLFRSMTHAAIYESALRRFGLDYYLVGGRAFFAQQEVYDILNLLRAVENPQDSTSLVGALRSPFFNLSDESVFLLAAHPDGPWAGLHDPERIGVLPADQQPPAKRSAKWLASWRAIKDRLSIAPLLNSILADSGYDAALQFEFLGDRKLANLWKLIELARSFDRTGLFGLHEFTARLGDLVVRQPREEQAATLPENADVVRLMSIHQAKGLEFPVVFIPDIAAQDRGDRHTVARWHRGLGCLVKLPAEFEELSTSHSGEGGERAVNGEVPPFSGFADDLGRTSDQLADWQEDLRVLYVACTRARDLLILSAGLPRLSQTNDRLPANHWTLTLEERFDIRTGQCLMEGIKHEEVPLVRVMIAEPDENVTSPMADASGSTKPIQKWNLTPPPHAQPTIFSLPGLEAQARGETVVHTGEHFDTENDTDRSHWRTPRERVCPVPLPEAVLWAVLEGWNFADVDGWVHLLADALEDTPDRKIGEELQPQLRRFAESPIRAILASSDDVNRSVEFLADFATGSDNPVPFKIRGVIDLLYCNAAGWHILGIDRGTVLEDDPWRGRRPGLVLQAWAVSVQLGAWPQTIGLFDLATGQLVHTDPRRFPISSVVDYFRRAGV